MLKIIEPTKLLSWLGFGLGIVTIAVIALLLADDFVAKKNKRK